MGAEPYICQNGLAEISEMVAWVEYCNGTEGKYAEMRNKNGHPEPFNVKYWSVGNERYDTAYIRRVGDAAKAMLKVEPDIMLTCAGSQGGMKKAGFKVSPYLMKSVGDYLDLLSVHNYWLPRGDKLPEYDYMTAISKSESPDAYNSIENPDNVIPRQEKLSFRKGITILPPHSLTIVRVTTNNKLK